MNMKRKKHLLLGWIYLSAMALITCATPNPKQKVNFQSDQEESIYLVLQKVKQLHALGHYSRAAEILKSIGRQNYSYYMTDDILYWLGRCRLKQGQYEKAARCFRLLRKYYPRCEVKFEDLPELEAQAQEMKPIEIKSESPVEGERGSAKSSRGPRISNVYYETDIRQVLADISAQTGITIIPGPSIEGYVTAEIKNLPLEEALAMMLYPLGYSFRRIGDFYLVGSISPESPSFSMIAITEEIKPRYRTAQEVYSLLSGYLKGYVQPDPQGNALIVTAPANIIEKIKEEVDKLDHPPVQVLIEATVVEMGSKAQKMLGIDWDWTGTKNNIAFKIAKFQFPLMDSSFLMEYTREGGTFKDMLFDMRLALRAMASSDKIHIRANPKITTLDGKEAVIRIGKEAYYSLMRGSTAYPYITLEKISTGIILKITPYVGEKADITADLHIEISDVTGTGPTNLPVTTVRSADTRVHIFNGQTVSIGGLTSQSDKNSGNRIPFLESIPVLGYLFGSSGWNKEKTEVIIFITPHILVDPREFDDL